jgi:hypothetical protein
MRTALLTIVAVGVVFSASLSAQARRGAAPPPAAPANPLPNVKSLKCTFPISVSATWEAGEPTAAVKKGGILTFQLDEIDTTESTANVTGLASGNHIVAQLSGWNLHFLDIRPTGSLTITTVFAQESRDKKLKAVHTRTDYLPVTIPGFQSKPDIFQYYGECEILG